MDATGDNLKKLLMYGVSKLDIDEKSEMPMSLTEEKAILATFSNIEFSDEIQLAIVKEREEPNRLFSKNALNRFLHTMRLYIGGRILGYYGKTKKPPEVAVVHLRIEYLTKEEYKARFAV